MKFIYFLKKYSFDKHTFKFKNIINAFVFLVLILALLVGLFFITKKMVASVMVGQAIRAGKPSDATNLLIKAISIDNKPEYQILLAQNSILELQNIVSSYSENKKMTSEDEKNITNIIGNILQATSISEKQSPFDYRTFLASGSVYESLAFYGLPDVYNLALASYQKASFLSETEPLPYLLSARVEIARENYDSAKKYLAHALVLKQNYSDAFVLLSDIAVAEGNMNDAEIYMERALEASPDSASLYFALGRFKYNNKNYKEAEKLFAESFRIDQSFSSARLAKILSIYSSGRKNDAIEEMAIVVSENPSDSQAKEFLEKMKDGTLLKIETEVLEDAESGGKKL